jgi:von Willebrand factor
MEGLCGNCNQNPDDDIVINAAKSKLAVTDANVTIRDFALSWLANEPKLGVKEDLNTCHIDEETDCLPLAPETDPCMKIIDEEIFGKCRYVVEPFPYVFACQQDLCRTGPTQKGACESIAAYARECARNNICVDWRRNSNCPMTCTAPYVYNPCGCAETCQTVEVRDKLLKASSAIRDAKTIDSMKSICSTGIGEGCFCPKGLVLHNGKCLRELECNACDDKVSLSLRIQ